MKIYVDLNELEKSNSECKRLVNELNSIKTSFDATARSLDWDIKSKASIQRYINNLSEMISDAKRTMRAHANFFIDTKEKYIGSEEFNIIETEKLKNNLYKDKSTYQGNNISTESNKQNNTNDNDYDFMDGVKDFVISPMSKEKILKELLKDKVDLGKIKTMSGIMGLLGVGLDAKNLYDEYKSGKKCIGSLITGALKGGIDFIDSSANTVLGVGKIVSKYVSSSKIRGLALDVIKKAKPVAKVLGSKLVAGVGAALSGISTGLDSYNEYQKTYAEMGRTEKDAKIDAAIDGACTMAIEGLAAGLTFVAPPVGAIIGFGISAANSVFGIDKGISTLIKTARYEGFDGVKSLVADKVSDTVNNIYTTVSNFTSGCKSLLSNFAKVSFT